MYHFNRELGERLRRMKTALNEFFKTTEEEATVPLNRIPQELELD